MCGLLGSTAAHEQPDDEHHKQEATDAAANVRSSVVEAAPTAKRTRKSA